MLYELDHRSCTCAIVQGLGCNYNLINIFISLSPFASSTV